MGINVLLDLWEAQKEADFFVLATRREKWKDRFFTRDTFDDIEEWVKEHMRGDIYWGVHGYSRPIKRAQYAAKSNLLWADTDAVDPRSLHVRPSIAWRTSQGRYSAVWRCDAEPGRALRRGFNQHIGADPSGWCLTKVLRLWGTKNWKYTPAQNVVLMWNESSVHRLRDLKRYEAADDDDGGDAPGVVLLDAAKVLAKFKDKIDTTLMDTAVDGKDGTVAIGGRYKIIWKLGQQLKAAGATRNEIGTLVYSSASWQSKHGRNSLGRLAREVQRILSKT